MILEEYVNVDGTLNTNRKLSVIAFYMNNANICILPDDGLSGPKHAEWNNRIICL
jgi:hypothetical protein